VKDNLKLLEMILTNADNDEHLVIRNSSITEDGNVIVTNEKGQIQIYRKKADGNNNAFDLLMDEDDSDDPDAQNGGKIKMAKKQKKGFKPF
jgi:hypothetical protein